MHSQAGEDDIVMRLFSEILKTGPGTYIDVGCNHPAYGSNTFLLYKNGWRGYCIDPHGEFAPLYAEHRPRDTFLQMAIGGVDGTVSFHYTPGSEGLSSVLPTVVHKQAMDVPVRRLQTIIDTHKIDKIDVLSVDVEGSEIDVINSITDYQKFPRIIIAEFNTLGCINMRLQPYLISMGYHILAVTYCNVIATKEFQTDWAVHPQS